MVQNVGDGAGGALLCATRVGMGRVVWFVSKYIHLYISIEGVVSICMERGSLPSRRLRFLPCDV